MRVFIIAGEASGDKLGAALMHGLRTLRADVCFDGVGGALMSARGLRSRFEMSELSVMGLVEVLPKYRHLRRRIHETARAVIESVPDVLITIDSPDFCLRVAQQVKAASNIRIVHYVAPSVWAWRPKRAAKIASRADHVLALLPFEPPYMHQAGVACDFVGHPVVAEPRPSPEHVAQLRQRLGVRNTHPLILALPGSRRGEIKRLAPRMGAALARVYARHPGTQTVLPVAPGLAGFVRAHIADWPYPPLILDPSNQDPATAEADKRAIFSAADVALAASGTVALELAAAGTPMVSMYDMHWLTRHIIQYMIKRTPNALATPNRGNLINIITNSDVMPELIGARCRPELIADALHALIRSSEAQNIAMQQVMHALGQGGAPPGLRAARAVLSRMDAL